MSGEEIISHIQTLILSKSIADYEVPKRPGRHVRN